MRERLSVLIKYLSTQNIEAVIGYVYACMVPGVDGAGAEKVS